MTWQPYIQNVPPVPQVPVIPVRPNTPLPFRQLSVKYTPKEGTEVFWAMHRWFVDPLPYYYQLQISRTPQSNDGWANVGLPAMDAYSLVDDEKRNWARSRDVWYRVVLTTGAGTYPSAPIQPGNLLQFRDWRLSRDIIRKELMLSRQYTGISCYYLKRKRYGTRCPRCVDKGTGQSTSSNCSRCWGTSIDGGYYKPKADVFVQLGLAATREQTDLETVGTTRPEAIEPARIIGDPLPDSYDAIIDHQGGRLFYVHKVTRAAEIRGYTTVVELELRPADFSDPLHNYPLDL